MTLAVFDPQRHRWLRDCSHRWDDLPDEDVPCWYCGHPLRDHPRGRVPTFDDTYQEEP